MKDVNAGNVWNDYTIHYTYITVCNYKNLTLHNHIYSVSSILYYQSSADCKSGYVYIHNLKFNHYHLRVATGDYNYLNPSKDLLTETVDICV